jgi:hypothetical protein
LLDGDQLKSLRLTAHAQTRLERRRIERAWVEATLAEPDWVEQDPSGPGVERRFKRIALAGGRILRVVCAETDAEIRVITALFDRNADPKP